MSNWKVGPGGRLYHPTTGAYVGQLDLNGNEQMVLGITTTSDQGVKTLSGGNESLTDMLPYPRRGSGHRYIMDPGFDTGWVRDGVFTNLAGGGQDWAISYGSDVDGPYLQASIASDGASKILSAPFPAAVDFSTFRGGIDLVADIDWPGGVEVDDFNFTLSLSQNSNFTNAGTITFNWYKGGTTGTLRRGRCILFARTEVGTPGFNWSVAGTYDPANPVTYAGVRLLANTTLPPAGFTIKIRELRARCINTPGVILGYDDAHASTEPLYRYALARGIRPVIPVCMNFVKTISNQMRVDTLLELQDLGAEILNHTYNHTDMRYYTYAQALDAIGTNRDQMSAAGINFVPVIVYPGGHYNDDVIQAAMDLGYVIGRSAGSLYSRVHPKFGLGNPMKLGSRDFSGQTLDTVLSDVDKMTTQQAHYLCWLYAHRSTPGNPASSSAAPADTLYWYDGWHRQVIDRLAEHKAAGRVRSLVASDLVKAIV